MLITVCALALMAAQVTVASPEGDCGFSKFRPRHITHFVDKGAISKVVPQYPPAAKAKGLSGTVRVRVLINRQGQVESTCPVYLSGELKPDRSLVVAAEAAALHWSFQPNFGLEPGDAIRFDYAQDVIVFKFDPREPKEGQSKRESDMSCAYDWSCPTCPGDSSRPDGVLPETVACCRADHLDS